MRPRFLASLSCLVVSLAALAGCSGPEAVAATEGPLVAPAPEVAYYVGTNTTTSPDGAIPYGPVANVAVQRTVDRAARTIVEHVTHPGRAIPTTLTQIENSNVFSATDDARSFTGTLTFDGHDWDWTGWRYDIAMADGSGTLRGHATITPALIETDKTFYGPDGTASARMREHLERVDQATYEARRNELVPPTP